MSTYSGKAVIITGGAGGMGRETARLLLDKGASVVLVDVNEAALDEACRELGRHAAVHVLRSDLSRAEDCEAALGLATGRLHGLVHLAGISVPDPDDPADMAVFDAVMSANTRNGYLLARLFAGRHAGHPADTARMVFASSLAFRRGGLDRIAYSASKGAVAAMVRALARRLAPNVLVNGVAPGIITTRMTDGLIAARGDILMNEIPIRRFGEAREVATVIDFLLGPASSYVNGQIINVDGGTVHS